MKGPGSGREAAIRALQVAGLEISQHPGRDADSAQRLPPPEEAQSLTQQDSAKAFMARYTDPSCRLCRREATETVPEGDEVLHGEVSRWNAAGYPPGQHGQSRRTKISEYGVQLREKQKVRRTYGLLETQFRNTFEKALRQTGRTGETLVKMLERRLDNVVYRLGFAPSRKAARQLVTHGHSW